MRKTLHLGKYFIPGFVIVFHHFGPGTGSNKTRGIEIEMASENGQSCFVAKHQTTELSSKNDYGSVPAHPAMGTISLWTTRSYTVNTSTMMKKINNLIWSASRLCRQPCSFGSRRITRDFISFGGNSFSPCGMNQN